MSFAISCDEANVTFCRFIHSRSCAVKW